MANSEQDGDASIVKRPPGVLLRAWLAAPNWIFGALGAGFFLVYAWTRMQDYFAAFPNIGPYWEPPAGGAREYFPVAKILGDFTFLLIALSFGFRIRPRQRAARARDILIPMIAGFWPLTPFFLFAALNAAGGAWAEPLKNALEFGAISYGRFATGVLLLTVGNALDVWGYATLFRSFSIVAEARDLKVTGPYRFVRHPVYLGQLFAQAGIWLVLIEFSAVWVAFYAIFAALQLYRSWIEDQVLARAFGESYRRWKKQTFWFF